MKLIIELNGNQINLVIKQNNKVIAESSWLGEYTLSEQLLPQIDALLKKNKIDKKEIEKVTTKISKTSGVTSSRIVQTVAKAWGAKRGA
jgi:tRNA A37 threonylcarbamoyladenosine modification protein TsaB